MAREAQDPLHRGTGARAPATAAPATLAKAFVQQMSTATLADGLIPGAAWKRGAGYLLDLLALWALIGLLSGGRIVTWAWSWGMLATRDFHFVLAAWVVLIGAHYLYFVWTGRWLGRSLGQRLFGLAVIRPDASPLQHEAWGQRSSRKLRYLVPVLGPLWFGGRDLWLVERSAHHRSSLDAAAGTVVVESSSLPPSTRALLR